MPYEEEQKPRFNGSRCMVCGSKELQDINDETHCMRCGAIHIGDATVMQPCDAKDRADGFDARDVMPVEMGALASEVSGETTVREAGTNHSKLG